MKTEKTNVISDPVDDIENDIQIKEGSETEVAEQIINESVNNEKTEQKTAPKKEKEKETNEVSGDILSPEFIVDITDLVGQESLPPLSNRFGTGAITKARLKLTPAARKVLIPLAEKSLAKLKITIDNPIAAYIEAVLAFYASVLVPDIIQGGAGKDFKRRKKAVETVTKEAKENRANASKKGRGPSLAKAKAEAQEIDFTNI